MALAAQADKEGHSAARSWGGWLVTALSVLAPAALAALIWIPEYRHFHAPSTSWSAEAVSRARTQPSDTVFGELRTFYLMPLLERSPAVENEVAAGLLKGDFVLPGLTPGKVRLPFNEGDFTDLPYELRLWFAGFTVPDFLLAGYVNTGNEGYFDRAREAILAWDDYERQVGKAPVLLWNDHAVSGRVRVLGEFWRLYRHRPDFDPEVGKRVLSLAARYHHFLADPGHFTVTTNHGLMQNLALLQLCLAFPEVTGHDCPRIPIERVEQQMRFYIDSAGVIRENSPGYQSFGLEMLGMTFRLQTMLGLPVSASWQARYQRGIEYLQALRRPDGTLPASGDTEGRSQWAFPRLRPFQADGGMGPGVVDSFTRASRAQTLHTGAGYWIDWADGSDSASQTVVQWAAPPSPAHKHADELSMLVWVDSTSWLTSVGYWPYPLPGRGAAESWTGSNAPHLRGEAAESPRQVVLLGSGNAGTASAIDLERSGPDSYRVRRQVVRAGNDTWIVIDWHRGAGTRGVETAWTVPPSVATAQEQGFVKLTAPGGRQARLDIIGADTVRRYRGSLEPLAGWHVIQSRPDTTTTFMAESGGDTATTVVILQVGRHESLVAPQATIVGPEAWSVSVGGRRVERKGGAVSTTGWGAPAEVMLVAPTASEELTAIRAAFREGAEQYPSWQWLAPRRLKVTKYLVLFLVLQELGFVGLRLWRPEWVRPLRLLSLVAWVGLGLFLHFSFLRSWRV